MSNFIIAKTERCLFHFMNQSRKEEALYYLEKNLKVEHYLSGPEQPHIKRGRLQTGSVWKFLMPVFSSKTKIRLEAYVKFHYCKDGTMFISFHESI